LIIASNTALKGDFGRKKQAFEKPGTANGRRMGHADGRLTDNDITRLKNLRYV
jgi:hypothetical protein